jgi:hypothetical protein
MMADIWAMITVIDNWAQPCLITTACCGYSQDMSDRVHVEALETPVTLDNE